MSLGDVRLMFPLTFPYPSRSQRSGACPVFIQDGHAAHALLTHQLHGIQHIAVRRGRHNGGTEVQRPTKSVEGCCRHRGGERGSPALPRERIEQTTV